MTKIIIIASPHQRNDDTETFVRESLPEVKVVRVRTPEELAALLSVSKPDWIFFPHWSWTIPREIYEWHPCVIFHMTDLPYGRGGSPLQNLIVRGHAQTKLSAFKCVTELDAGPIYLRHDLDLGGSAEAILRRAATEIGRMIVRIAREKPEPTEQDGDITRFTRRKPEESRLPDDVDLKHLYDFIRMLDADGYPRAFVDFDKLRFELWDAHLDGDAVEARVRIRIIE